MAVCKACLCISTDFHARHHSRHPQRMALLNERLLAPRRAITPWPNMMLSCCDHRLQSSARPELRHPVAVACPCERSRGRLRQHGRMRGNGLGLMQRTKVTAVDEGQGGTLLVPQGIVDGQEGRQPQGHERKAPMSRKAVIVSLAGIALGFAAFSAQAATPVPTSQGSIYGAAGLVQQAHYRYYRYYRHHHRYWRWRHHRHHWY